MIPITEVAKGIFKIGPLETGSRTPPTSPYLVVGQERALIWEPGETGQMAALLEGIRQIRVDLDRIAYIITSHIHLHHCQGVPELLQKIPKATLMVHNRAIPYLIEPTQLNESTFQVWGPGCPTIAPVPEKRMKALYGGEVIDLGKRKLDIIEATGHAPHQVAMFDRLTKALFPGDAVGVLPLNNERASPDIRAPLFDVEKAVDSLHRLMALKPKVLFVFGYGGVSHSPQKTMKWAEEDWRTVERICREGMKQKKNSLEIGRQVVQYYTKVGVMEEEKELRTTVAPFGMTNYLHKQDPSLEMPQRDESQPLHGRL
jgi:glyoxylase-like metal-dependent hydrolase (beta-lactamase superfamily II)